MTAQARNSILTDSQWYGLQRIATQRKISLTELLDKLSSGELIVVDPEKLEDRLDLLDALETLAEMKASDEKPISWKQVVSELGTNGVSSRNY